MKREGFTYHIASDIDADEFLAELLWNDEQWAEISLKNDGELLLTLYPRDDGEPWRFDPIEAEELLNAARRDLVEGGPVEGWVRAGAAAAG